MRGKLRKVKDKLSKKRKDSVFDESRTNSDDSEIHAQPSLLGLPAELRNGVYQYLAASTTLVLSPASPKKRPAPIGLLLACQQTLREYRAILMTQASLVMSITNYNFSHVVRTFEKMNEQDLSLMKLNRNIWIYLQLGHVPSRDDKRALKAWCDYRCDPAPPPYFGTGTGQRVPQELVFQYDVQFSHQMRPPRPIIRYANGYEMKLELLHSHLRMANRLQPPEEEGENFELKRLRGDLRKREEVLEDLLADVSSLERRDSAQQV